MIAARECLDLRVALGAARLPFGLISTLDSPSNTRDLTAGQPATVALR